MIVNVSSGAADLPLQLNTVYSAAKVILSCMGQLLSQEIVGSFIVNGNVPRGRNKSMQKNLGNQLAFKPKTLLPLSHLDPWQRSEDKLH